LKIPEGIFSADNQALVKNGGERERKDGEKGIKRFRVSGLVPIAIGIEVRGSSFRCEFTVFSPAPCTVHFATDSEIYI